MNNNPQVELPPSILVRRLNQLLLIILVGNLIYVILSLGQLPDEVPIHFNIAGEPDNWSNKYILLIFPLMFKVVFILLYFFSKDPTTYNFPVKITEENALRIYRVGRLMLTLINVEIAFIMLYITWSSIQIAKGFDVPGIIMPMLISLPIITIILFYVRMKKIV